MTSKKMRDIVDSNSKIAVEKFLGMKEMKLGIVYVKEV